MFNITLAQMSVSKLKGDDIDKLLDLDIGNVLPMFLSKEYQLEKWGYVLKSDGKRVTSMLSTGKNDDQVIVTYRDIDTNLDGKINYRDDKGNYQDNKSNNVDILPHLYPTREEHYKLCGPVLHVINLRQSTKRGYYHEYLNGYAFKRVDLSYYNDWIANGKFVQYFPDGSIEVSGYIRQGMFNGPWKRYSPKNKSIIMEYNFDEGLYHGVQCVLDAETNSVIKAYQTKHGRLDGYIAGYSDENEEWDTYQGEFIPNVTEDPGVFCGGTLSVVFYFGDEEVDPSECYIDFSLPDIYDTILLNVVIPKF